MPIEAIPPPGLGDRLRRLAWQACWALLYRLSPTPLHGWRRFLLRLWGARVERRAHPYPSARIWAPWNLVMEEGSCLGPESDCYNVAEVRLGKNSIISQKAYLCTASHDIRDPAFPLTGAAILIGAEAWVAAGAFVGPDVSIGERAVAAACAVVSKSVEPAAIVAGNPAKTIGRRELD